MKTTLKLLLSAFAVVVLAQTFACGGSTTGGVGGGTGGAGGGTAGGTGGGTAGGAGGGTAGGAGGGTAGGAGGGTAGGAGGGTAGGAGGGTAGGAGGGTAAGPDAGNYALTITGCPGSHNGATMTLKVKYPDAGVAGTGTTVIQATQGTITIQKVLAAGQTYNADYCIELNGTAGCQFPADHQWRRQVVGDGGNVTESRPHADSQTDVTPF